MSATTCAPYTRALSARLLVEANDLKRTAASLVEELALPLARIHTAIEGRLEPAEYKALFERMADRYPVALGRLWIEPTDADFVLRHMSAAETTRWF